MTKLATNEQSTINYQATTDEKLLDLINKYLTAEEAKRVRNMTLGLKPKLDQLNELKRLLLTSHSNIADEIVEYNLARALARTKTIFGTSLATNEYGNLHCLSHFGTKGVKVDDKLIDNYKFMSKLRDNKDSNLERLLFQSTLREILDITDNILMVPSGLIVEVKKRSLGIKPIDSISVSKLKFD